MSGRSRSFRDGSGGGRRRFEVRVEEDFVGGERSSRYFVREVEVFREKEGS